MLCTPNTEKLCSGFLLLQRGIRIKLLPKIIVLPVIIILCIPLLAMAEELKRTHSPMIIYWLVHVTILVVSFAVLQTVSDVLFETLI